MTIDETAIYVCKESFTATIDGQELPFAAGRTRVRGNHPVLLGREHLFELLTVDYDIEQATAAPGARRGEERKPR